jgi:hypothetical protein
MICVPCLNFLFPLCIVQIKLKYPSEYLRQIEGSYGDVPFSYGGQRVIGITSITFKSNFRVYGPYGKPGKDTFKSESGKIVGFWGGAGLCLDSIGVFTVNPTDSTLYGNVY